MSTDAELVARAHDDPSAFRELYERHATRIHAYLLRRTREPEAAQDLTAETFAQAWMARRRFRDDAGGSAAPWLFGIARHVLLSSVRRRRMELTACRRLGLLSELDRPAVEPEPHEGWLDGLDDAMADLPDDQREAIRLRVVEDLTYADAARRTAQTPEVMRTRVSRGLRTLRTRLDATGGDR